ncbi:MAG: hypothetical protein ACRDSJ_09065 [Rubrobacteraceae bacterium]
MNRVTSRDGAAVAYGKVGEGSPIIVVGGQLLDWTPLGRQEG